MTIRDNVEAGHRLLTDELHITHLRAIVGFSMGAEQAFQWAVSYPTFASRIANPLHGAPLPSMVKDVSRTQLFHSLDFSILQFLQSPKGVPLV